MKKLSTPGGEPSARRGASTLFFGAGHALAAIALGLTLALALPASATSYPAPVLAFCELMARLIPSIEAFESVSAFPVVTRLFLSIHWALVPILVIWIRHSPQLVTPNRSTLSKWPAWKIVGALIVVCLAVIVFPAVVQVRPDDLAGGMLHERALRAASTSRFWMGLIGSLVIFTIAYFSALVISYVRWLLDTSNKHG